MKIRIAVLVVAAFVALGLAGCNEYADVQTALSVTGQVIAIAKADLPALCSAGTFSTADCTAVGNWLTAADTFEVQAAACVTTAGAKGAKSAFAGCVTAFGTALVSPTMLADLRVISAKSQRQVTIWVTAVILAANAAGAIVAALPTTPPVVGTAPAPTAQELNDFKARLNLPAAYGQ